MVVACMPNTLIFQFKVLCILVFSALLGEHLDMCPNLRMGRLDWDLPSNRFDIEGHID